MGVALAAPTASGKAVAVYRHSLKLTRSPAVDVEKRTPVLWSQAPPRILWRRASQGSIVLVAVRKLWVAAKQFLPDTR